MPVDDYNATPANNSTISGINIAEGCAPAGINNAIRQLMADIVAWRTGADPTTLFTNGGTMAGNYTFTGNVQFDDLTLGGSISEAIFTIVDAATVDINPANGTIQFWTLGGNRTATFTNFANGQSVTLLIDDGVNNTVTWTGVQWKTDLGQPPLFNASGFTFVSLVRAGGVTYGFRGGDS